VILVVFDVEGNSKLKSDATFFWLFFKTKNSAACFTKALGPRERQSEQGPRKRVQDGSDAAENKNFARETASTVESESGGQESDAASSTPGAQGKSKHRAAKR
jgi:hypothetical protein